jgi:hypothetical protein
LLVWKLRALQHVQFLMGKGMKKYRALETVGAAIGQSEETLRSWQKLLFEDEDMEFDILAAHWAGAMEREIDSCETEQELIAQYGNARPRHRNMTGIQHARDALHAIRATPLDDIREGIMAARSPTKNGAGPGTSDTKK